MQNTDFTIKYRLFSIVFDWFKTKSDIFFLKLFFLRRNVFIGKKTSFFKKNSRIDSKNIFYHFASLKGLLTEADKKLLKELEGSLEKKKNNLKPPFGECFICQLNFTGPKTARNE